MLIRQQDEKYDKLDQNKWMVTAVESREGKFNVMKLIGRHSNKEIHIICHGNKKELRLGGGLSIEQLTERENKDNNIVIWSCEAGKEIESSFLRENMIIAKETKLGRGKTISGYGEISEVVKNLKIELQKNEELVPVSKNLKAKHKPRWDEKKKSGIYYQKTLSLSQKINLPKIISLNGKLNARIESEKRNFREWSILLDGEIKEFKFKLPEEIAIVVTTRSYHRADDKYAKKSWRIEGDQSLVNSESN